MADLRSIRAVDDWLSVYRRFWDESFDRLAACIDGLKGEDDDNRSKKGR
jgi:hypothetical protein